LEFLYVDPSYPPGDQAIVLCNPYVKDFSFLMSIEDFGLWHLPDSLFLCMDCIFWLKYRMNCEHLLGGKMYGIFEITLNNWLL
jgi:hypothetical protein